MESLNTINSLVGNLQQIGQIPQQIEKVEKGLQKEIRESYPNFNSQAISNLLHKGPKTFIFSGNAFSLQTQLDNLPDYQLTNIHDASIKIAGKEFQPLNQCSIYCTCFWGSLCIFPLCFKCCDWWKKCTFPAYDIPIDVYISLGKLINSPFLKNMTLVIADNCFNNQKAQILFDLISRSNLTGFTFLNTAGGYNFRSNQYSNFKEHMISIKNIHNLLTDIRWDEEIV